MGKSTLLNALLGEPLAITSHHPQTTRDRLCGVVRGEGVEVVLVDTPGIHGARTRLGTRMNALARGSLDACDAVLLVVELSAKPRPELDREDRAILDGIPTRVPVVLVLNKVDRVKPKELLFPVLESLARARDFAGIFPISAKRGGGVAELGRALQALAPEGEPAFEEDEITDRPLRFFASEYVREQILRATRQEVPHGVAVTVESYDESRRVPRIALVVHVDKESHKPIVLGRKGARMKEIATLARARFEELAGKQVHLEIRVKVTPGWYEDPRLLDELGYGEVAT